MGHALQQTGPLPLRRRPDGFAELLSAIISQQVSTASASAIWARMQAAGLTDPDRILAASEDELRAFPEPGTRDVVPGYVARYWDLHALADRTPALVIGENGVLRDKPGFEVGLLTRGSSTEEMHRHDRPSVLMPVTGHWNVVWACLLYTSPSPRDGLLSRMPSSA